MERPFSRQETYISRKVFLQNIPSFVYLRKDRPTKLDSARETLNQILTLDRNWIISSGGTSANTTRARSRRNSFAKCHVIRGRVRNNEASIPSGVVDFLNETKRRNARRMFSNVFDEKLMNLQRASDDSWTANEADFERQNRLAASFICSVFLQPRAMSIFRNCITTGTETFCPLSFCSFVFTLAILCRGIDVYPAARHRHTE